MIDPQTQANQWIRRTYSEDLRIMRLSESTTYAKVTYSTLIAGYNILIENILEEIDPALDNILMKKISINDGVLSLNLYDK